MTIFSKIINGEITCYKISENDEILALLEINQVAWSHTLVVPRR